MLTPMEKDQFWHMIDGLTAYDHAVEMMQSHHRRLVAGEAGEAVFLLSHPPVYTAGTSARREDLLEAHLPKDIQIIADTGRGGQWTYHGPGQRIIWPVLDLNRRKRDIRAYIHTLEGWVMQVLDRQFGITSQRREGLPGLWVSRSDIGLNQGQYSRLCHASSPILRYGHRLRQFYPSVLVCQYRFC